MSHYSLRLIDNDKGEITVTLGTKEIRGWSYFSEPERRQKMLQAREFVEGWHQSGAPDLLAAVKAFEKHFGPLDDNPMLNEEARDCFSLARAAVSKAKGY